MSRRPSARVMLVGQVIVDVLTAERDGDWHIRLGGIAHAARGMAAIGCPFGIGYFAPDYLDASVEQHAEDLGAVGVWKVGSVTGAPNVLIVREPRECGPQGYELLLRSEAQTSFDAHRLSRALESEQWTDVLAFPGGFDDGTLFGVVAEHQAAVHVDASVAPQDWASFGRLRKAADTLIMSTSSPIFRQVFGSDPSALRAAAKQAGAKSLLLKENRGGTRYFGLGRGQDVVQVPAQPRRIVHSVGVGDCFDAVFVGLRGVLPAQQALAYASCISAEYATTTSVDGFIHAAQSWQRVRPEDVAGMRGVALAWEDRAACNIYVAGPDFRRVDTSPIKRLASALAYHNFTPRLPVQEVGELPREASPERRAEVYRADLAILDGCAMVVGVLLFDDPGTLVEIGMALERGMPVIVYDPYGIAENPFVTEGVRLVSGDLDEIIVCVFEEAQEWRRARAS
jgi:sugar/nucleoside kinase (ribokinase family)